ncbi:protein kinase [Colletotrichum higginsianum]|uniref:Protein kinase n=1 Tax=Colletotrichum higginsianum (strain IMI 349063) TaxID=759273 RepID=H1VIA8_COLHI|nr:protein kinase [Colletotrichum higginsianum]
MKFTAAISFLFAAAVSAQTCSGSELQVCVGNRIKFCNLAKNNVFDLFQTSRQQPKAVILFRHCAQTSFQWHLFFNCTGFPLVSDSTPLEEEEHLDEFKAGQYYPAIIGDVYDEKYQVLGKLDFGSTSTVDHIYVASKSYTVDGGNLEEFQTYEALGKGNRSHPGYPHNPMWDSWKDVVRWNPAGLFNAELLKAGIAKLFLALNYLHSEDIKAENIMLELMDVTVLEAFARSELEDPSPRKFVDGAPIYKSRQFGHPKKFGDVVLGDFGAAVRGDRKRNHDAQPNVYRSPEVMLKTEWSYPIDVWNVGVMARP